MQRVAWALAPVALTGSIAISIWSCTHAATRESLPLLTIHVDDFPLLVEVAETPEEWARGMMFRKKRDVATGMLFKFKNPMTACFWMKNTYIPLDVAFIDAHGAVVAVDSMLPQSLDKHCAATPVSYALEIEHGSLGSDRLHVATHIDGLTDGTTFH
jgi:uncharacterized protein